MISRRAFLRTLGAGVAGGLLSGTAIATHSEQQPDHVTIAYEPDILQKYQPLLDISQSSREKLLGLYGWTARSPEYDTAVCVFWCSYTHQEAAFWAPIPSTAHYGDHEPIQVEFNPDTGEVERVRASIYHWIKGEATGSSATLSGTNPLLKVIDPYHHYTAQPDEKLTSQYDVKDLTQVFDGWLDNGLEEDLVPGACYNPWIMRSEPDFWAPGQFGLPSTEQIQARAFRKAGFGVVGSL